MTKKQREDFLSQPCESNIMWAAQEIAALGPDKRYQIVLGLKKLNEVLYKSWAKDLTLNELMEAIDMIVNPAGGQSGVDNMQHDPNAKAAEATNEQATEQESAATQEQEATQESAEEGGVEG